MDCWSKVASGSMHQKLVNAAFSLVTEALAVQEGVSQAKAEGFRNVCVMVDSKQVSKRLENITNGRLLLECELLKCFMRVFLV